MCSLQEHIAREARAREAAKDTPIYEAVCRDHLYRPDDNG